MTNMLKEGMRAAISCQILEGDLPVTFRWERNGKPLIGTGSVNIKLVLNFLHKVKWYLFEIGMKLLDVWMNTQQY